MKKQLIIMMILIFTCALIFGTVLADAANGSKKNPAGAYKYHTSIVIQEGDSLWSLAQAYAGHISLYDSYIQEVKAMNGLSGDQIHTGQNLLIIYYSDELK